MMEAFGLVESLSESIELPRERPRELKWLSVRFSVLVAAVVVDSAGAQN